MCESSVYVRREDRDELLIEEVARVVPEGPVLRIITLLGEERRLEADLLDVDLMGHRIVVRERG